jgi:hypothetical protein
MSHGWLRTSALCIVAAAQIQLIFAAELHRHGYPVFFQPPKLAVRAERPQSTPTVPGRGPCLVCLIVRQGAAQPSTPGFVLQPVQKVVFHPAPFLTHFVSLPTVILAIRAPPLPERVPQVV